jgi:hypothetical protein
MSLLEEFFLLFVASACTGVFLVYRAYHGRRIGDHLHCRKCEFDLYGLPPDASTCPECGTFIRYGRPRGKVEHRPTMMRWGLSLAIVGALGLIIIAGSLSQSLRWRTRMPMWYLLSSLRAAPTAVRSRELLQEIDRRFSSSSRRPTTAEVTQVSDVLLDLHQRATRTDRADLARMIEQLQTVFGLPANRWNAYLTSAIPVSAQVRPIVGEKDPLGALLVASGDGLGRFRGQVTLSLLWSQIDGLPASGGGSLTGPVHQWQRLEVPTLTRTSALDEGRHTLTLHYQLDIVDPATPNAGSLSVRGTVENAFEVKAGFDPLVMTMQKSLDPGFGAEVRQRVGGVLLTIDAAGRNESLRPVSAYDVALEFDGVQHPVGGFVAARENFESFEMFCPFVPTGPEVRLIFKPSRERALSDPRVRTIDGLERSWTRPNR